MRPRPGRIQEEVVTDLPRPRDRQSAAFDFAKRRVMAALDRSLDRSVVTPDDEIKVVGGGASCLAVPREAGPRPSNNK